jgi:hypothetical protein
VFANPRVREVYLGSDPETAIVEAVLEEQTVIEEGGQ